MRRAPAVSASLVLACTGPALGQDSSPPPPAVNVGGFLQLRETYQDQVGLTGTVHRARLIVDGALAGEFSFRLSGEFRTGGTATTRAGVSMIDAYIRWSKAPWTVTVGQFKTPFSREFQLQGWAIETADRATVVDSLAPRRDIGLTGAYAFGTTGAVSLGVFNGEGQNSVGNRDSTVLVVGRVTAALTQAVELGANFAAYGPDSARYGADARVQLRKLMVRGEFIGQQRSGMGPDDSGWYVLAVYSLRPRVHLVARQEDFRRPAIAPSQRVHASTGGVNLYFSDDRVRLTAAYVSRRVGSGTRRDILISQLQVRF